MSVPAPANPLLPNLPSHIDRDVLEPEPLDRSTGALPPEGNVQFRNYRSASENVHSYSTTGETYNSLSKDKLVSMFDICTTISPPRSKILELLRPEDPGRDAIEAIVHPASRRGLALPLGEDTRRFLQRSLLSPNPRRSSTNATPLPEFKPQQEEISSQEILCCDSKSVKSRKEKTLADEIREAEEECFSDNVNSEELGQECRRQGSQAAKERERLGRLALAVEEDTGERDETGLGAAARRLDALLSASRDLHHELAGIHEDMQVQCSRAAQCTEAARALGAETRALRFLDDLVALLRGDVGAATTASSWPFVLGSRHPDRNYIV